jgi:hypothetical protein
MAHVPSAPAAPVYHDRLRRRLRNRTRALAFLAQALAHGRPALRIALREVLSAQGVVQTGNLLRRSRSALRMRA